MDKESIQLITEYLDQIGEKLGVGTQTIWPWFVKQQIISSYVSLFTFTLFAILSIICVKKWMNGSFRTISGNDSDAREVISVIFTIIVIIGMIASLASFFMNGINIFNPEYHAFKELLYLIK